VKKPSTFVWRNVFLLTGGVTLFSVGVSTGIRFFYGAKSDTITILMRLIMPVVITMPLAIVAFTWIERLEQAYASLLKEVRELGRAASTDPLTGLLNRRSFEKQFDSAMRHRSGGKFILADVDYLKTINDRFGHVIGDDAIQACASALSTVLGDKCLIARIGGDEFCAFLPLGSAQKVEELSKAINEAADLDLKARSGIEDLNLSISVGMAACPLGSSFRDIMDRTDSDLYRKKIRRSLR